MPLGQFARSVGHNASLAQVVTHPAAQAFGASFAATDSAIAVPAAWTNLYRLAYEKACLSLAPSVFQVMLEPSMN